MQFIDLKAQYRVLKEEITEPFEAYDVSDED